MKKSKKDNRARGNKKTISFKEEDDVEVFYEPAGFGIPLKVENDEENVENENSAAAHVRRQSEIYTSWKERNGNPTERNSPGRYSMFVAGIQQFDPYQELTSTQIAAFRQVFDMVDKDGGGSIDADELYGAMKDLEPSLKLREIREIIEELDRAGNGTIDFDEFLYMMTSMSMQVETHPSAGDRIRSDDVVGRKRQSVFFSVITKFAMRHSLKEIERYYASKSRHTPHVVAHYAAGACVEGLSEKELRQEWRHLLMASKGKDSPYAQPLNFYTTSPKKKPNQIKKRSSNKNMISPELQRLGDLSPSPTSRSPTSKYSQYSRDSDSPESVELDRELAGSRCSSRSKSPGSPRPESRGWTPRHGLPITKVPLPMVIYNQSKVCIFSSKIKIK